MHTNLHQIQIVPESWRSPVLAELAVNEQVLACLPLDLDAERLFCHGILVLTPLRLLAKTDSHSAWSVWPLDPSMRLIRRDYAGVGTLDLYQAAHRRVSWHYTLTHHASARTLVELFESVLLGNLQEGVQEQ